MFQLKLVVLAAAKFAPGTIEIIQIAFKSS